MNTENENNIIKDEIIEKSNQINIASIRNEFLKEIKKLKNDTEKQLEEQNTKSNTSLLELDRKISIITEQNSKLKDSYAEILVKLEKVKELDIFKKKIEDKIITHEIRINNTMKDLNDSKFKYDKIFINNLLVPGFIGPQSQFKTMGEYIYDNIINVSGLNSIKEQMKKDIIEIKLRLENMTKEILTIVNSASHRCNDYSDNKNKILENELKLEIKTNTEKIMEVRLQNVKEAISLEKKTKEFQNEWDKILNMKNDIDKKLNDHLLIYKTDLDETLKTYNDIKNQFNKIKMRFGSLVEFIKDVRFRKNLGNFEEVKKKDIKKLTEKLEYKKKKDESIDYSFLDKVDLDYDCILGKDMNSDDDDEDYEKKEKVITIFKKLTNNTKKENNDKSKVNNSNNSLINDNENNNNKQRKKSNNKNNIKVESKHNEKLNIRKSIRVKTMNPGRRSVNVNFYYNNNFDIKEVGDFVQKENKINILASPIKNRRKKGKKEIIIPSINLNEKSNNNNNKKNNMFNSPKRHQSIEKRNIIERSIEKTSNRNSRKQTENIQIQINQSSQDKKENLDEQIINLKSIPIISKTNSTKSLINNEINPSVQIEDNLIYEKLRNDEKELNHTYFHNTLDNKINQINLNLNNNKSIEHHKYNSISINTNKKLSINNIYNSSEFLISPKKNEHQKTKIYINNTPKDYDPNFNFNFIQLNLEKNIPQNLSMSKNVLSEKDIRQNRNNKKFQFNNNKQTLFIRTFSPKDYHKEIIDSDGNQVYKRNLKFNDILPSTKQSKK